MKRGWTWVIAVLAMVCLAGEAKAQSESDVAVLITEVVGEGVAEESPGPRFWWSGGGEPVWTATDEIVFEALRSQGLAPLTPGEVNISRIYRRPLLPTANAAQLGGLLGARRVLVGKVEYQALKPVAPLGYVGIGVVAEVELVAGGATDGVSLQRYTVSRKVYGEMGPELFDEARKAGAGALGEVMGRSLRRSAGEVGASSESLVLILRNVGSAANLELVRRRLLEIEEVERVGERWASEGIIALEINPGMESGADVREYAIRVLENHSFDEFHLQRSPRPAVAGTVEFWLESRGFQQ